MTRGLLRAMRDKLGLRIWVALGVALAALASAPWILSSRFVTERRAAHGLDRAKAHLTAGELDAARKELRAALRLRPGNAEARHRLATLELGQGNWEIAFLEFQSLTELHPEDPNGWTGLARLMLKTGLLGAPEAALDKAIAAAPGRADARMLRADLRLRSGRYHGAHLDAQAAVAAAGTDAAAWGLLVRSAARSQGTDAGIEAARKAVAAVGNDPAVIQPLAWLLAERGRAQEGVKLLEQIVAARPGSPAAWSAQLSLARVQLRAGERESARKHLETLLLQRPLDDEALALRAVLDATRGRVEASLADLDAALRSQPMTRALRDLRARLESARNDPGAIEALLADLVGREMGPAPVPATLFRAEARSGHGKLAALGLEHWPGRLAQARQALEVRMRQRNWTGAEEIVEAARRTYPDTAFASFLAGILELARGNADAAERFLSESLQAAPRSAVVATALAKTWSRQKGAAFAGERLMRLAEEDKGFAFARYLAARAYMDGRDPILAEAAVRRGIELQPDSSLPYQQVADYYQELDRPADTLAICLKGLDRFPQDLDLQLTLARIDAGLGRSKDAIGIYGEVLSRRPDLDLVEYKVAALLASEDKDGPPPERLRQILQRLESDRPSDPLLLDSLGWAHYRVGSTARARALLEEAVSGAPDEPASRYHLAVVYAREKKAELARSELKAALDSNRLFPERLDAMRLLRESDDK